MAPGMRVLIVDNYAGVTEALKIGLEDYCTAVVTEAATSAIAACALRRLTLDLAVIDTALPGISSFELSEKAANSNVPVLLISGDPKGHHICETNHYPWLAKPFPLAALATAMEITRAPSENIARLHQAYAQLRANLERSERVMEEAGRIVSESQRLMSLITAARMVRQGRNS
jgi:DNA-binding NtrC family response regulator